MGNLLGWLRGRRSISWSCTESWGRTKPSWGYHCHHAGWHAIYTVKDKFAVSHGPKCLFYLKLFVLKWEIYVHDVTKVYLPKCIDTIVILVYLIDQESIVFTLCRWYNQHFSSHKHRCKNNKFIASREMFLFFFSLNAKCWHTVLQCNWNLWTFHIHVFGAVYYNHRFFFEVNNRLKIQWTLLLPLAFSEVWHTCEIYRFFISDPPLKQCF